MDKAGRHMEPFLVEIMPDETRTFQTSSHEGEEFMYILGGEVGAFIILKDGMTLTPEEVGDFCRGQISRHKIPRHVFCVKEYPVTGNGKVQKYKLRERAVHLLEN